MERSWSRQGMLGLPGADLPQGRELVETGDARLARGSSLGMGAGRDRGCWACQELIFLREGSWSRQGMLGLPGVLPQGWELVETGDARLAKGYSSSW